MVTERGNNHSATKYRRKNKYRRLLYGYKVLFRVRVTVDLTFYTTSWLYYHISVQMRAACR